MMLLMNKEWIGICCFVLFKASLRIDHVFFRLLALLSKALEKWSFLQALRVRLYRLRKVRYLEMFSRLGMAEAVAERLSLVIREVKRPLVIHFSSL